MEKHIEKYYRPLFEDVRMERSLVLYLALTDENVLKQVGYPISHIMVLKNIALEKLKRQLMLVNNYLNQLTDII